VRKQLTRRLRGRLPVRRDFDQIDCAENRGDFDLPVGRAARKMLGHYRQGKWVEIKNPCPMRSMSTSSSPRSGNSGAASRVASPHPVWGRSSETAHRRGDMTSSNAWAEFAAIFTRTRSAHLSHEQAKSDLKSLVPADAQQAIGHGIRAKRSKSGAVSLDLLDGRGQPCSDPVKASRLGAYAKNSSIYCHVILN
jgi:hypothetical protein